MNEFDVELYSWLREMSCPTELWKELDDTSRCSM
jgi:hypothetical protein